MDTPKMLTVTAQQSRFHNEAIEGSALKEVGLRDMKPQGWH